MPPRITKPGPVPQEALDYFAAKGIKVGFNHADVWKEEHGAAFTAAKILELDVLAAVRGTIERAIEKGTTFEQFKRDILPLLDKSGWSNYHKETQKKHRLRKIYDTNMRVARAAGQWQRIQRTKTVLPFLLYGLGPSVKHREEHEFWEGTLLPVDDPFWADHFVPNGFGCKCWIRQVGTREVEKRGGITVRPPSHDVDWTLPDGRKVTAPVGIDPGWDYNPGMNRTAGLDAALEQAEGQ